MDNKDVELGEPPVIIEKADLVEEEQHSSKFETSKVEEGDVEDQFEDKSSLQSFNAQHLNATSTDMPLLVDPVSVMGMPGSFGGSVWANDSPNNGGLEEVTANVQELGTRMADMASTAGKEAVAVVQDLGNKMPSLPSLSLSLANWWTVLDPVIEKAKDNENRDREEKHLMPPESSAVPGKAAVAVNVQATFGLPSGEGLIEVFECKLVQSHKCTHNSFTPDMVISYSATLYVTDRHACFSVDTKDKKIHIKLDRTSVKNVSRLKARRGETSDSLKLHLGSDQWLIIQEFERTEDIESALALLEHLTS